MMGDRESQEGAAAAPDPSPPKPQATAEESNRAEANTSAEEAGPVDAPRSEIEAQPVPESDLDADPEPDLESLTRIPTTGSGDAVSNAPSSFSISLSVRTDPSRLSLLTLKTPCHVFFLLSITDSPCLG